MKEKLQGQGNIDNQEISNCEDNNCIWGYVINKALSESQGEVSDYRFRSIFLNNKDGNKKVAQGIWNKEEVSEIQSRFFKNKPDPNDYYEKGFGIFKSINFSCNKKVFEYLVEKKVFQASDTNYMKYKLNYPRMFGEKEDVIEINAFVESPLLWFEKKYIRMSMFISDSKQKQILK